MSMPDPRDPRGLIREAFRMEGIGLPECRSIFLDWALGVGDGQDMAEDIRGLLADYGASQPQDHPMFEVLRAALVDAGPAKRRGGRKGRVS